VDGFSKLLVMIETECSAGGAFASDPRSRELLEVALRLRYEAQTGENKDAPIPILPSIAVRPRQDLLHSRETTGSFGRLLLFVFLLLAWIGIVTLLVEWLQTR
jgi:hypothetical protein